MRGPRTRVTVEARPGAALEVVDARFLLQLLGRRLASTSGLTDYPGWATPSERDHGGHRGGGSGQRRMSGQPPTHLLDLVPDAEALLLLQPEEIGELLMEVIHAGPDWGGGGLTAAHAATEANRYPPQHREALREAIVEAWSWLENAGLISRYKPGEGDPNQCFVTRRARSMRTCADVALYRKAGLLPKELLHRKLVEKVWTLFIRGDYETAVFQAFWPDPLKPVQGL